MAFRPPTLFKFLNADIASIEDTDLFQDTISLVVAYSFVPDPTWYRGDPVYLENLTPDPLKWWGQLKQYPDMSLAYISPCEEMPDECSPAACCSDIGQDCDDRLILVELANRGDRIAKYTYYHHCQSQAVFITAATIKCLWGGEVLSRMYLRTNGIHSVLTNFSPEEGLSPDWDEPFYFDFIAQEMEAVMDSKDAATLLEDVKNTQYIPYPEALEWFVKNFRFHGDEELVIYARELGRRLLQ